MSTLLNSSFGKRAASFGNWLNPTPLKRYLHRAVDFTYAKLWKQEGTDFQKEVDPKVAQHLYQSPSLVERILKTMTAMGEKGYTPFLHAMPASAKVVRRFSAAVQPTDDPHFKYLRSPSDPNFQHSLDRAAPPLEGERRSDLLSMSYGLTSGVKPLESAASWGFRNHFGGKEQNLPMGGLYENALKEQGLESQSKPYHHFWERGWDLIQKYNGLQVGDFMVVGVPKEKVDQYVYDSKPYNFPTGEKASQVAAHPERYRKSLSEQRTHMATLRLCRETLSPRSGMKIVDTQDEREVEDFCSGMKFRKMGEFPEYKGLVSSASTDFERSESERRRELDRNLERMTDDFKSYRRNPSAELPAYSKSEENLSFDFEFLP